MLSSHAQEYHAFARECLEMAEKANAGLRSRLIELSRQWMGAAIAEELAQNDAHASVPAAPHAGEQAGIRPSYRRTG